jgi:hypothetical protein
MDVINEERATRVKLWEAALPLSLPPSRPLIRHIGKGETEYRHTRGGGGRCASENTPGTYAIENEYLCFCCCRFFCCKDLVVVEILTLREKNERNFCSCSKSRLPETDGLREFSLITDLP